MVEYVAVTHIMLSLKYVVLVTATLSNACR